jgi:predicted ATPase
MAQKNKCIAFGLDLQWPDTCLHPEILRDFVYERATIAHKTQQLNEIGNFQRLIQNSQTD